MSDSKEEGIVSLERLLAYHKRTAAYSIVDHAKSRTASKERTIIKSESLLPEDIIRTIWGLLDSAYFKEITQDDLDILHGIANSDFATSSCHLDEDFQSVLQEVFRPEYLQMEGEGEIEKQLHRNWYEEMYIYWNLMLQDSEAGLHDYWQFQKDRETIRDGTLSEMARKEHELFHNVNSSRQSQHPIEKELAEVRLNNCRIIDRIFSQIHQKSKKNYPLEEDSIQLEIDDFSPAETFAKRELERKTLLRYFKYEIGNLEKKQVAECICKINSKRKTIAGNVYEVTFEETLQLGTVEMDESELNTLNQLRETSLLQFYQAGWKGRFNFVCHNYLGFNNLATRDAQFQQWPSLFTQLASSEQEGLSGEASKTFEMMEACHECRLLYDRRTLLKCTYVSTEKQDLNFPSFYDPYIYFLLKQDPVVGQSVAETWKDSLLSNPYRCSADQRECGRYFCKMCNKGESVAKCRFCLGVCTCTRCIRNNTIIKFKTIYAILGGDIAAIEKDSYFAKICSRPPPKAKNDPSMGGQQMWISYKVQLEELRLMAHTVMRRELLKEEKFANEEAILRERLKILEER